MTVLAPTEPLTAALASATDAQLLKIATRCGVQPHKLHEWRRTGGVGVAGWCRREIAIVLGIDPDIVRPLWPRLRDLGSRLAGGQPGGFEEMAAVRWQAIDRLGGLDDDARIDRFTSALVELGANRQDVRAAIEIERDRVLRDTPARLKPERPSRIGVTHDRHAWRGR